jgi:hypothetical protein
MKVQIITPYRVSHLERYGGAVRSNVTSVPTFRPSGHWDRPVNCLTGYRRTAAYRPTQVFISVMLLPLIRRAITLHHLSV